MFFGKKDPKKDNSPRCKINTLVRYMSFGPSGVFTIITFYCMCLEHLSILTHFYLIDLNMYINQFIVIKMIEITKVKNF